MTSLNFATYYLRQLFQFGKFRVRVHVLFLGDLGAVGLSPVAMHDYIPELGVH